MSNTCTRCRKELTGRQRLYCSPACKVATLQPYDPDKRKAKYQARGVYGQRTCEMCGEPYQAKYKDQRTCSRLCGQFIRRAKLGLPMSSPWTPTYCTACGDPMLKRPNATYCEPCSGTAHLGGTWVRGVKVCTDCATPIPVHKGSGNHCADCVDMRRREWERQHKRQYGNHRKRARTYGVDYEPVNAQRVHERDNYTCHICGEPTDPTAHYLDDRYPSLDHIIPISRGGPHTYSNVATAHRLCNSLKRDLLPSIDTGAGSSL